MQGTTECQLTIIIIGRLIERLLLVSAGIFCIYIGYLLYVGGVSGNLKLQVETTGQKYQIENAAPGIVMALFGTFILIRTTFRPWERRLESPDGSKEVQFLSDSQELSPYANLRLNMEEIDSLFKATYDTLGRENIDSKKKTDMRKVYSQVYNQFPGLPEGISPDRLPKT